MRASSVIVLSLKLRIFSFSRAASMIVVYEQIERDESSTNLIHRFQIEHS